MNINQYIYYAYINISRRKNKIIGNIILVMCALVVLLIANTFSESFNEFLYKTTKNSIDARTIVISTNATDKAEQDKISKLLEDNINIIDYYKDVSNGGAGGSVENWEELFGNKYIDKKNEDSAITLKTINKEINNSVIAGRMISDGDGNVGIIPKYFVPIDKPEKLGIKKDTTEYFDGEEFIGKKIKIKYEAYEYDTKYMKKKPCKTFYYTFEVIGVYDNVANLKNPNEIFVSYNDVLEMNNNVINNSIPKEEYVDVTYHAIINKSENVQNVINELDNNQVMVNRVISTNKWVEIFGMLISVIGSFMTIFLLCIASINIYITTYNDIIKRKVEIGLLKSIGYTNNHIKKIMITESIIIGLISLISSFIIYAILFISIKLYLVYNTSIYMKQFNIVINSWWILIVILLGIGIPIISIIRVGKKINKISIIKAFE